MPSSVYLPFQSIFLFSSCLTYFFSVSSLYLLDTQIELICFLLRSPTMGASNFYLLVFLQGEEVSAFRRRSSDYFVLASFSFNIEESSWQTVCYPPLSSPINNILEQLVIRMSQQCVLLDRVESVLILWVILEFCQIFCSSAWCGKATLLPHGALTPFTLLYVARIAQWMVVWLQHGNWAPILGCLARFYFWTIDLLIFYILIQVMVFTVPVCLITFSPLI